MRILPLLPVIVLLGAAVAFTASGFDLVRDSVPRSDIVIPANAVRRVRLAAEELQSHIRQISGATLPIVDSPGAKMSCHVYVGESAHTKKLGIRVDGLKPDGFKVVSGPNWLVLLGRDYKGPVRFIPDCPSRAARPKARKAWQEYTGEKWEFPSAASFKMYSKELDFWAYRETGTLFAVYEFLEDLGVRWYMPYEHGTVLPKLKTISVGRLNLTREPEFEDRSLFFSRPFMDPEGTLWFKRLKLGKPRPFWRGHANLYAILKYQKETHPEYFAVINGKRDFAACKGYGRPCLTNPGLIAAVVKYGRMFFDKYPDEPCFPVMPPDSFSAMCECKTCAPYATPKRGYPGKMSDYVWAYVDRVAREIEKTHPGKYIHCCAYGSYLLPPLRIDKMNRNVAVTQCQRRNSNWDPEARKQRIAVREAWLKKLPSGKFFIWDYYLFHRDHVLPGIPIIFPRLIQEDLKGLKGVSGGDFIEGNKDARGRALAPGLNHLNYYVNAKLYWDVDLDVDALLEEYYTLFYGPAHAEMKAFFTLAEKVWMRRESRKISSVGGFLKKADVERYFQLLKAARQKAGDTIYGKRIDLIVAECRPMKALFANLQRTGPRFVCLRGKGPVKVDGVLDEAFWHRRRGYGMKTLVKGRKPKNGGRVRLRWVDARSLAIGVECEESEMKSILAKSSRRDDPDLWRDDVIEVFIETQEVSLYHFVFNANGNFLDECTDPRLRLGKGWESGVQVAAGHEAGRWTLEIVVPVSAFKGRLPTDTYPWGINIGRYRPRTGEQAELTALAPTGKRGFLLLQKMGNMVVR